MVQLSQNSQKCRVLWYNCHRTHRSVGYCIQISQGNLCGVPDVLQNSQKCRVLWCNCHRTHRSIGYCGTAVTELTEVLCRVKTEGNYPRYRSVGTLQNLSVEIWIIASSRIIRDAEGIKHDWQWAWSTPISPGVKEPLTTTNNFFRLYFFIGGKSLVDICRHPESWRHFPECLFLSLIHIWRCRRSTLCRSRWSPYH